MVCGAGAWLLRVADPPQIRDPTRVSCIGGPELLTTEATREAPDKCCRPFWSILWLAIWFQCIKVSDFLVKSSLSIFFFHAQ